MVDQVQKGKTIRGKIFSLEELKDLIITKDEETNDIAVNDTADMGS